MASQVPNSGATDLPLVALLGQVDAQILGAEPPTFANSGQGTP